MLAFGVKGATLVEEFFELLLSLFGVGLLVGSLLECSYYVSGVALARVP